MRKIQDERKVYVSKIEAYDESAIYKSIPKSLFDNIQPGFTVVIKPNWIRESHIFREAEWDYVITHPTVISAVLAIVLECLKNRGKVIIADAPETASNFEKILAHYPIKQWENDCAKNGISLEIIDLRDDEWMVDKNVVIERKKLPGDPRGSTEVNLKGELSEFYRKPKSSKGFFGADSNINETNKVHNGIDNIYRVSKSIIEADVFINICKLKTHKKSGITCCLKNLVGINTYKNFLPHCTIGTQDNGGDQFPSNSSKTRFEATLMPYIHQYILKFPKFAKFFSPFMTLGKNIFGTNQETIRGGGWHGNDTLWRTVLDLNKILFYADPVGNLKNENFESKKKYIGIVDAILAGEGNGPKSPDPIKMNYVFFGVNPVAIDTLCATLMNFDPLKIPVIKESFHIKRYPLTNFSYQDILMNYLNQDISIAEIPPNMFVSFTPSKGWQGSIEK
jgi:uncharacterized protein (DUF362 family)